MVEIWLGSRTLKSSGSSSKKLADAFVMAAAAPTAGMANPAVSMPPALDRSTKTRSMETTWADESDLPREEDVDMVSAYGQSLRCAVGYDAIGLRKP